MKRRQLAVLLIATILGGSISAPVYAEDYTEEYAEEMFDEEYADDFSYEYDEEFCDEYEENEDMFVETWEEEMDTESLEDFIDADGFIGLGSDDLTEGIDSEDYVEVEAGFEVSVNPLYVDVVDATDLLLPEEAEKFANENGYLPVDQTVAVELDKDEYLEFVEAEVLDASAEADAAATLREGLKNREASITVVCNSAFQSNIAKDVWAEAMAYTGDAQEGDYLRWNYAGWAASYRMMAGAVRITYKVTYYTTAAQENAVSAKINEVLASLSLENKSYTEGLKAIYDYICLNVAYDYDCDYNDTIQYTAYAALINGKAVCQGYASLLYRMAVQAGYEMRMVTGYTSAGDHAWNLVAVNGLYYYADTTRDASSAKRGTSYNYFLIGSNTSKYIRDNEFATAEFTSRYPMADADYHEFANGDVIPATCETPGKIGSGNCILCGKKFNDWTEIPATGHQPVVHVKAATTEEDGCFETSCETCGKILETVSISRPVNYVLSETKCVYDGMEHPVSVQITDAKGNTIPSSEYTVKYYNETGSSCVAPCNADVYTVEVSFTGNYTGTHTESFEIKKANQTLSVNNITLVKGVDSAYYPGFSTTGDSAIVLSSSNTSIVLADGKKLSANGVGKTKVTVTALESANYNAATATVEVTVLPKGTDLTSLVSKSANTMNISWAISRGVTGYEIQYSTNTTFKNPKTVKVTSDKVVSTSISKLTAGTKYYVRIRTYQQSSGVTYSSAWSNTMSVRIVSR